LGKKEGKSGGSEKDRKEERVEYQEGKKKDKEL